MTTYRITFGYPDWNTTQIFEVDVVQTPREAVDAKAAVQEGFRRCDGRTAPVLLFVERRQPDLAWDVITTAFRAKPGTQVMMANRRGTAEEAVTIGRWQPRGDGRAYLIDEKGTSRGIFAPDDVLTLRPHEEIAEEEEAKAAYDAEMGYERHLESAGYEEARAQEAYEASLGIFR